jgi:transcription antitermination factor NusG
MPSFFVACRVGILLSGADRKTTDDKNDRLSHQHNRQLTLPMLESQEPTQLTLSIAAESEEWYALSVKPRHDKTVAHVLDTKGYRTFLPTYKKRSKYGSHTKETELPLFPGYVFCRLDPVVRLPILMTPGVVQILGVGRMPVPVDESEIASLRSAVMAGVPLQPYPQFQTGQKVRVVEGALAGVEGTVMNLKQGPRLVLSVTLLQRSVLLEIDCDRFQIEPVPHSGKRYVA